MEKGLCSISHWLYVVRHGASFIIIVSYCPMTDVIVGISEVSIKIPLKWHKRILWNPCPIKLTHQIVFVDVMDSSTLKRTILYEPQPYVPSNPIHENDIERLLSVESESVEGAWSRVKKTKDAEVWRRESNEDGHPPITKVIIVNNWSELNFHAVANPWRRIFLS